MNFHYSEFFFLFYYLNKDVALEYSQLLIGVDMFTEYYLPHN